MESKFLCYLNYSENGQVCYNTRVSTQVNTSEHESTRVNTNQQESTRINASLTRVNTSPTQVNMSPTRVSTNQHESKTNLDHKKMAKQNSNVTYPWCFLEKHVEGCICHWFKFFSPIYFQRIP